LRQGGDFDFLLGQLHQMGFGAAGSEADLVQIEIRIDPCKIPGIS
jgi:hypothetical protein